MASSNAAPISGGELVKVIQGGFGVWLNRVQFAQLVALAPRYTPRPFYRPTTLSGKETFEALQDGNRITMNAADVATWLAGTAPIPAAPGAQATNLTGIEVAPALQMMYKVGLNLADIVTVRSGGGDVTDLTPSTGGGTIPAPVVITRPSIGTDGTPQVGELMAGQSGTYSNGTVTARQWLLGGNAINGAMGASYTPQATGSLVYQETVTGAGGAIVSSSDPVTVTAANVAVPNGFYLNGASNTALKAMLARVKGGTGRGRIIVKGDSLMVGVGAADDGVGSANCRMRRVPAVMSAALTQAAYPCYDWALYGDGGFQVFSNVDSVFLAYDTRIAFTNVHAGSSTGAQSESFPGGTYFGPAGNGSVDARLTQADCDSFRIALYNTTNTSSWTVQIDGAAPASGPSTIYAATSNNGWTEFVVKAPTVGTHTLRMFCSDNQTQPIRSIQPFNSTRSEIEILSHAVAGAHSDEQTAMDTNNSWYNGNASTADVGDLFIFACYANDIGNAYTVSQTVANVTTAINQGKAAGRSVLIVGPHPGGGTFSSNNPDATHAAVKNLCAQQGVSFMSMYEYFGSAYTSAFAARIAGDGSNIHGKQELQAEEGGVLARAIIAMAGGASSSMGFSDAASWSDAAIWSDAA